MKFNEVVYSNGDSLWIELKNFELFGSSLTHERKGYTCRACQEKVHDQIQMWTSEPHQPTYHIRCYEFMYSKMINELVDHHNNLSMTMTDEETSELETTQELKDAIERHTNGNDEN